MPKKITPLSPTTVSNAKAKLDSKTGKPKDTIYRDGDNLELLVKASGIKLWYFRYYKPFTQKRTMIAFGEYPSTKLADARRLKDEAKAMLAKDIDPVDWRKQQAAAIQEENSNTLRSIATRWFEVKKTTVSEDYAKDIWRSLEKDIFPKLGDVPISSLKAPMLVEVLKPIEARGNLETIKRLTQRTVEIIDYAMNLGVIDANPFTTVSKAFPKPKKKHNPTIRPEELPGLMQALSIAQVERQTRLVIEWQLLTAVRPGEAVKARWSEIDFENKVWNIPAATMKTSHAHTVPLCKPALDLLEIMKPISGHRGFVFPHRSTPSTHMSSQTANMALKRMGYQDMLTAHGIRSIVSTAMNEQGFMPDAIEAVLAHREKNSVRAAYNRATYLEQRRVMMDWWGLYVKGAATGDLTVAGSVKGLRIVGSDYYVG
ncbi:tyrosine-type recombinase/integrase [Xenorhabdus sp. PB61.4]|uniref:integrase domain-containing protein n=1 Tax=Xenorhabdus sp. PB61.4 TaxID=2788940 RepID=UPI001E48E9A4|nr:integrase domain-containing protein [Xenorhabdus sp. PB61.4]MCC8367955.1 tyrosine-type recombinase/integrase [Xenorhabdus sp. PB61.4]